MLKKNQSIKNFVKDIFYFNSFLGRIFLFSLLSIITIWFFWSDQRTSCLLTATAFSQYNNSISRELELSNLSVANANFLAFINELKILKISNNLKLENSKSNLDLKNSEFQCSNRIVNSKIKIPIFFASQFNGYITGEISYYPSLISIIFLWVLIFFLMFTLRKLELNIKLQLDEKLINPIRALSSGASLDIQNLELPKEVVDISENINELKQKIILNEKLENEIFLAKEIKLITAQVSHDIRSPLSALTMLTGSLNEIPEAKRILVRSAINRITDIANNLLEQSKVKTLKVTKSINYGDEFKNANQVTNQPLKTEKDLQLVLLPSLIDSLVSEKRIQFRDKSNLRIQAHLETSYGVFVNVIPSELSRVLSNTLNNSIEAFDLNKLSTIDLAIETNHTQQVLIRIKDNGKGIPAHILEKLGAQGVTHGKEGTQSGSGLGIYHAKKTIEFFNGTYQIESVVDEGVTVILTLPKSSHPNWFVQSLNLKQCQTIVATDDDQSILEIWKQRFSHLINENQIILLTFSSGAQLGQWIFQNKVQSESTLYLIDYEFLGQPKNGLELIEEFKISHQSILVTSRYEEKKILNKCEELNVRLIPKGMAPLVPIEVQKNKS